MTDRPIIKILTVVVILLIHFTSVDAQTFVSRNAYIGFFSKTPMEDIKAENKQVVAAIDLEKKTIAFNALLKSFLFRKELMQQHFNENYVESDKYPKASFLGNYTGEVNPQKAGRYPVQVNGKLTLHGVTRNISIAAFIVIEKDKILGSSNFQLVPSDFNIKIPSIVRDKIAEKIDVAVKVEYPIK